MRGSRQDVWQGAEHPVQHRHGAGVPALNTTTQSCSAGSPRNTTELRTVLPILGAQRVGGGEYGIAVFAWWYF